MSQALVLNLCWTFKWKLSGIDEMGLMMGCWCCSRGLWVKLSLNSATLNIVSSSVCFWELLIISMTSQGCDPRGWHWDGPMGRSSTKFLHRGAETCRKEVISLVPCGKWNQSHQSISPPSQLFNHFSSKSISRIWESRSGQLHTVCERTTTGHSQPRENVWQS